VSRVGYVLSSAAAARSSTTWPVACERLVARRCHRSLRVRPDRSGALCRCRRFFCDTALIEQMSAVVCERSWCRVSVRLVVARALKATTCCTVIDVPMAAWWDSSGRWSVSLWRPSARPCRPVSPTGRSRYLRSGDGHPSPSPERKSLIYGFERITDKQSDLLLRTHAAEGQHARKETAAADRDRDDDEDLGDRPGRPENWAPVPVEN
jgi:hypothetical protein